MQHKHLLNVLPQHIRYTHLYITAVTSVSMRLETKRLIIFSIRPAYWIQNHFY